MLNIYFSRTDQVRGTGFKFIFENYLNFENEKTNVLLIDDQKSIIKDYVPTRLKFILFSLLLWVFILPLWMIQRLFFLKSKKINNESNIFVMRQTNLFILKKLFFNEVDGFYCVDSIVDYYNSKHKKNFFLARYLSTTASYVFELYIVLFSDCKIYFNSQLVSERFVKRFRFADLNTKRVKALIICPPHNSHKIKLKEDPNYFDVNIALYANFDFFESKLGAITFLKSLSDCQHSHVFKDININIFGKSADKNFKQFHLKQFGNFKINVEGLVEDIYERLNKNDLLIIPVESTNGVKIKVLEALDFGIPVMTTKNVAMHIPNYKDIPMLIPIEDIELFKEGLNYLDYEEIKTRDKFMPLSSWAEHFKEYKALCKKT